MLDGRRKSIQAIASRLPDGNEQNPQQFVNQSTWIQCRHSGGSVSGCRPSPTRRPGRSRTCRCPRADSCRSPSSRNTADRRAKGELSGRGRRPRRDRHHLVSPAMAATPDRGVSVGRLPPGRRPRPARGHVPREVAPCSGHARHSGPLGHDAAGRMADAAYGSNAHLQASERTRAGHVPTVTGVPAGLQDGKTGRQLAFGDDETALQCLDEQRPAHRNHR